MTKIKERLAELRTKIAQLKEERANVEGASVPRAEGLDLIDRTIKHNAGRVKPMYGVLVRPGANPSELDLVPIGDVAGAFCSLVPDLIRDKLVAEMDRQLEARPSGLPTDERPSAIAKLDAEILQRELAEESLICTAAEEGFEIDRRSDASPTVVLEVVYEPSRAPAPPARTVRSAKPKMKRRWKEADLGKHTPRGRVSSDGMDRIKN